MAAVACTMAVWSQAESLQTVGSTSGKRIPIVPNACNTAAASRNRMLDTVSSVQGSVQWLMYR